MDIDTILKLKTIPNFKLSSAQEAVYHQFIVEQQSEVKPNIRRATTPVSDEMLTPLPVLNTNVVEKVTGILSES